METFVELHRALERSLKVYRIFEHVDMKFLHTFDKFPILELSVSWACVRGSVFVLQPVLMPLATNRSR